MYVIKLFTYHIADFLQEKISQILRFCGDSQKMFSAKILFPAICKFSSRERNPLCSITSLRAITLALLSRSGNSEK